MPADIGVGQSEGDLVTVLGAQAVLVLVLVLGEGGLHAAYQDGLFQVS